MTYHLATVSATNRQSNWSSNSYTHTAPYYSSSIYISLLPISWTAAFKPPPAPFPGPLSSSLANSRQASADRPGGGHAVPSKDNY